MSRQMSRPRIIDMVKMKRFARYLKDKERVVTKYRYQDKVKEIVAWTDTDFEGCHETRKSTSGGVIMLGEHMIKSWSLTQTVVALSSGEAEYYGMVKGASNGLGMRSIIADLGIDMRIGLKTDSSAAKGIANRTGLGRV